MVQTVTLQLTDEMLRRFHRGATIAHKPLEQFITERLLESVPPPVDELSPQLRAELEVLEALDTAELWRVAQMQLSPHQQKAYDRLLDKNSQGALKAEEQVELRRLGDEARNLTLKKAHAFLLLRWRGQNPSPPLLLELE
jgi:hypothetical protein